jgi:hypothetical protein
MLDVGSGQVHRGRIHSSSEFGSAVAVCVMAEPAGLQVNLLSVSCGRFVPWGEDFLIFPSQIGIITSLAILARTGSTLDGFLLAVQPAVSAARIPPRHKHRAGRTGPSLRIELVPSDH